MMTARVLYGKKIAEGIKAVLKDRVAELTAEAGRAIRIVNVLVSDDPGARSYAEAQRRAAEEIGIHYELQRFSHHASQGEVTDAVQRLSDDRAISGILIQKPVPGHIDFHDVFSRVSEMKDIEGLHPAHAGLLVSGRSRVIPCTAAAVLELIRESQIVLRGKDIVVIGASEIVGKPLALLLLGQMATVTVCHIATAEAGRLKSHVQRADVVIVAVGKPDLVSGDMIKPGAVVIDVGMNQVDGKTVGDVQFDSVVKTASIITPVTGGVGPLTVMMLMRNAVEAFYLQNTRSGL